MGIALLSPWWGIGAVTFMAGVLGGWAVRRWNRSSQRLQRADLVRALCELNARVATDPDLAALLVAFTESPLELDRIERVRARAWFDSARRLHRLLHAVLEREGALEDTRSMWVPSMGEGARPDGRAVSAPADGSSECAGVSNITLIDPEFMAWVEAMREVRSA